jgi:hypothetical protein
MGLVDDLALIAEKIEEAKSENSDLQISFSFNEIAAGNDYQIVVRASSLSAQDIVDFISSVMAQV